MIINALIIALIVFFIKATTWKGHIFEGIDIFLQQILTKDNWRRNAAPPFKKEPMKIYKPLIGCNICMTPWWGFVIYTIAHYNLIPGFEPYTFWRVLLTLFIAGGISALFNLIGQLNAHIERTGNKLTKLIEDLYS